MLALLAENRPRLQMYLRHERRQVVVAELRCPHFGHYVWNALSAWDSLLPDYAAQIDQYVVWAENSFTGKVNDLFPELDLPEPLAFADENDFVRWMYSSDSLVLVAKDNQIGQSIAARTLDHARRSCPPKALMQIQALRQSCSLVVLLSLRLGNRAWLEQQSGYVALAKQIASKYSGSGFIIDGLSGNTTKGWTHSLMSVSDEVALASAIVTGISQSARCVSTVGATLSESLVASAVCDVFISPAGSAMAKYKWLANKPGVVVSNATASNGRNSDGAAIRVFEHYREGIISSCFVHPQHVQDVEAPGRPGPTHANFHLDWQIVAAALDDLLQSPRFLAR